MWLYTPLKSALASACLVKDCEPGSSTWASRIAPCATLSGKHTQPQSWQRAWKKAPWMARLFGPTYSPSTVQHGVEQWIAEPEPMPHGKVLRYESFIPKRDMQALTENDNGYWSAYAFTMLEVRGTLNTKRKTEFIDKKRRV